MATIHEERDFERDTGVDGKSMQLFQCGRNSETKIYYFARGQLSLLVALNKCTMIN